MRDTDELDELMLMRPYDLKMVEILERAVEGILEQARERVPTVTRGYVARRLGRVRPAWQPYLAHLTDGKDFADE